MAAHWLSLRTTVSAVENLDVVCDALAWLVGDEELVNVDKTKSHHGSVMYSISCKITKKKSINQVIANLGSNIRQELLDTQSTRLDSSNSMHFRIDKSSLIASEPALSPPGSPSSVKASIKLKIFGDETPETQLSSLLG